MFNFLVACFLASIVACRLFMRVSWDYPKNADRSMKLEVDLSAADKKKIAIIEERVRKMLNRNLPASIKTTQFVPFFINIPENPPLRGGRRTSSNAVIPPPPPQVEVQEAFIDTLHSCMDLSSMPPVYFPFNDDTLSELAKYFVVEELSLPVDEQRWNSSSESAIVECREDLVECRESQPKSSEVISVKVPRCSVAACLFRLNFFVFLHGRVVTSKEQTNEGRYSFRIRDESEMGADDELFIDTAQVKGEFATLRYMYDCKARWNFENHTPDFARVSPHGLPNSSVTFATTRGINPGFDLLFFGSPADFVIQRRKYQNVCPVSNICFSIQSFHIFRPAHLSLL